LRVRRLIQSVIKEHDSRIRQTDCVTRDDERRIRKDSSGNRSIGRARR